MREERWERVITRKLPVVVWQTRGHIWLSKEYAFIIESRHIATYSAKLRCRLTIAL